MRLTNIESIAVPGEAAVGLMDGLKQQRRWQVKFIFLQQQLFQDEYSAVFYSILLRAPASREDTAIGAVATCEANESVKRALEKQASQQKVKKRTHFSRDWPRMGMLPPQSQIYNVRSQST